MGATKPILLSPKQIAVLTSDEREVYLKYLDNCEREACEKSLALFIRQAWKWIDPAEYQHNWHIDAIATRAEAIIRGEARHLICNQPPRSMKSILFSVCYPAWVWAQSTITPLSGAQVKFIYASYGQSLALEHSALCRNLIQSPWYQKHWGDRVRIVGGQDRMGMFGNDAGGYRIATSVGGSLTGRGADCIIVDDALNAQQVTSEAERTSMLRWWSQALSTRLNDPKTGVYIVVEQRQHEEDLTGHILSKDPPGWTHIMYPMRYDPDRACEGDIRTEAGELLWPERLGESEVKYLESELGPYGAAGQLQQTPIPEGGGIVKRDWFNIWPPEDEESKWMIDKTIEGKDGALKTVKVLTYPSFSYILVSCDTAFETKQESDYSACVVLGVWHHHGLPQVMVMEAWRGRLEIHDVVNRIIETSRKRQADALLIEGKASGKSVRQEIRRMCGDQEFMVMEGMPENDKVARTHAAIPLLAAGCVWMPERAWSEILLDEVTRFPKGKHDDQHDALMYGLLHLRKCNMALLPDEGERAVLSSRDYKLVAGERDVLYDV